MTLALDRDGAALSSGAALPLLPALLDLAASMPAGQAGIRLHGAGVGDLLASEGAIAGLVGAAIGPAARPVRAILFDKPAANRASAGIRIARSASPNAATCLASGPGRSSRA